jgi:hypothetical protein
MILAASIQLVCSIHDYHSGDEDVDQTKATKVAVKITMAGLLHGLTDDGVARSAAGQRA